VQALIDSGKDPDIPAAIVRRCSFPDQRVIRCRLADVPARIEDPPRVRPPAIVIVGPVAAFDPCASWFERRPLFGRSILVTRPLEQSDGLVQPLTDLGADVLVQPAITISAPPQWDAVDAAIARLGQFEWLVFSSANGVRFLLDRLWETSRDMRALGKLKFAAIGAATADALARYHLRADVTPDEFRAEALAEALSERCRGQRCLLARASRGREVLAETLTDAGAIVEQVVVYESRDVETPDADVVARLNERKIDWITVTSSAIARSLAKLFEHNLRHAKLVSISPITSQTLRELGNEPAAEARAYSMAGVVEAILAAER
jgi:uroporphyrinogen III methyltransferase/synthase